LNGAGCLIVFHRSALESLRNYSNMLSADEQIVSPLLLARYSRVVGLQISAMSYLAVLHSTYLLSNSSSLATLAAAIRPASSRVSIFAADRRPGSSSN
jgi:hypothetical protein